jgi:preprotein translocase subunit SecA
MRVFASDTIKGLMGRFGIPEDEAIENSMVTRALESAQTKIEGFNFDSRKHVLEYDNVLDKQRRAIYAKRRAVLVGSDEEVDSVLMELALGNEEALSILGKKQEELGRDALLAIARTIILQTLDMLWVDHLEAMEYLRGSVNLRAYGQRDPLVEYRKEGTHIYKEMEALLTERVFDQLGRLTKEGISNTTITAAPAPVINLTMPPQGSAPVGEIHRNDPCPCGSGKKWKNCGLKNTEEHQRLMAAKK